MIHPCFVLKVRMRRSDSGIEGTLSIEQEIDGEIKREQIGDVWGLSLKQLESIFKHEGAGYQTCFFLEVED